MNVFEFNAFAIGTLSATYFPSILAGLLICGTFCFKRVLFPGPSKRRSVGDDQPVVILCGPMGSGKTKLWTRLVDGSDTTESVTTLVSQTTAVRAPGSGASTQTEPDELTGKQLHGLTPAFVTIVDTPAHPRLRAGALATNLVKSTNVVFVIDSNVGLSGRGLRDTAECLNLVLSYLLLLSHRRAPSELPKLAIHLASFSTRSQSSLQPDFIEKTIPKINATLNKELNRRRIASINIGTPVPFEMNSSAAELEAVDSGWGSGANPFLSALRRGIKGLSSTSKSVYDDLPDDESELMRLLDEEDEQMIGVSRNLNALEQYETISGLSPHWLLCTPADPYGLKAFWSWLGFTSQNQT